ncbi:MAG: hypothetical protein R3194_03380 [Limnobacter sp.]|nr:hypothetical protein [Limnobacter sp.]
MHKFRTRTEKGFVVAYVTYGIALLAVLGVAYGKLSESRSHASLVDESVERIVSSFIIYAQRVESCAVNFPAGNHGQFIGLPAYPAPATPGHRDDISNVECPGVISGITTIDRFGYLPPAPPGFRAFEYQHTQAGGVQIILAPLVADGEPVVRRRVLRRLEGGYSVASGTGGEIVMTLVAP